jgi:hypothetical protein
MRGTATPTSEAVEVTLPEAPPETYLSWTRWWRRTETDTRRGCCRGLAVAPGLALRPHPTSLLWEIISQDVAAQARSALRTGRRRFRPRIHARPAIVELALDYADRRGKCLQHRLCEGSRQDLGAFHKRVLQTVRWQLISVATSPVPHVVSGSARRRVRPGSPMPIAS